MDIDAGLLPCPSPRRSDEHRRHPQVHTGDCAVCAFGYTGSTAAEAIDNHDAAQNHEFMSEPDDAPTWGPLTDGPHPLSPEVEMSKPTLHHTDVVAVVILPRPTREILARLASRLATRGNGMSKHAQSAVDKLLSASDRTELTYLEMIAANVEIKAESDRLGRARRAGALGAREVLAETAVQAWELQVQPQAAAQLVDLAGVGRHRAE